MFELIFLHCLPPVKYFAMVVARAQHRLTNEEAERFYRSDKPG
jgi:hypothetical protein